ncbi:hypothetical protein HAX54_049091 [Datura stramonium]|uniref:Uncharacterized protein n=1 Tax=Datura stramonium TaxID=4076 RepID=A0ABS8WK36_DATST|nr:hypothetical protein [Datura stramonium]
MELVGVVVTSVLVVAIVVMMDMIGVVVAGVMVVMVNLVDVVVGGVDGGDQRMCGGIVGGGANYDGGTSDGRDYRCGRGSGDGGGSDSECNYNDGGCVLMTDNSGG